MNIAKVGLVIGRINPPHKGHKHLIQQALNESDFVIVCLGSSHAARTPKNPFTSDERAEMISMMFNDEDVKRLEFISVRDYLYSDTDWVMEVRNQVKIAAVGITHGKFDKFEISLYGFEKDKSSSYLKWFPEWKYVTVEPFKIDEKIISATHVRDCIFGADMSGFWKYGSQTFSPDEVKNVNLVERYCGREQTQHMHKIFASSESLFDNLNEWAEHVRDYKEKWKAAPYPPMFITCDPVVFCNGYVLTVTRGDNPGRHLLALPGGFLEPDETIEQGILRELREETKIDVPPKILKNSLKEIRVFDAPDRSSRGRTVTHAGLIVLDEPALPKVKAGSDAKHAQWIALERLPRLEAQFFEDHYYIIQTMMTINKI
jgi:bifunctional NMN adenylyltransferase/nudix hydrolase